MAGIFAAVAVLAGLVLVSLAFRPTPQEADRRTRAIRFRQTEAFTVLGAFPSREAMAAYENPPDRAPGNDLAPTVGDDEPERASAVPS